MIFDSIAAFSDYTGTEKPKHDWIDIGEYPTSFLLSSPPVRPSFYRISIKTGLEQDKAAAFMYFSSPNQPIVWETDIPWTGFYINITEELISNHQHLKYSFLSYGLHEPLTLSAEEEALVLHLFQGAGQEYQKEHFSVDLLVAYCNLIFSHVAQFYRRQFGENKERYSELLKRFFAELGSWYDPSKNTSIKKPTVKDIASRLHITPNYLSDVAKFYTGRPALEHINQHIVETAKSMLVQKKLSVSETAYQLGFEYPNYFSRLFRKVTGQSPSAFRNP